MNSNSSYYYRHPKLLFVPLRIKKKLLLFLMPMLSHYTENITMTSFTRRYKYYRIENNEKYITPYFYLTIRVGPELALSASLSN